MTALDNQLKPWVVQKYGGTSIGKSAIGIVENIVSVYSKDYRVAVVCSARSTNTKAEGTTSRLLRATDLCLQAPPSQLQEDESPAHTQLVEAVRLDHLAAAKRDVKDQQIRSQLEVEINSQCDSLNKILNAAQVIDEISARTRDNVMGVGEKLSCLYMTALLRDYGIPAEFINLDRIVPSDHKSSDEGLSQSFYDTISTRIADLVNEMCPNGEVPVITGYFGLVPGSLLNAVGRGYTDLCAALTASGLQASELQVWKEVDGIFTADPRKVPTARLLSTITPEEASELTYYGSEVIHPFTMEQVIRHRIPIRIMNVENPSGNGTVIFPDNESRHGEETPPHPPTALSRIASGFFNQTSSKQPTAVTTKHNITVINVHSNKRTLSHGFLASIFATMDKHCLVVDLISTSEVHVSMALHSDSEYQDFHEAVQSLRKLGQVDVIRKMCIVSLVGKQMKQLLGIAGRMFTTLGDAGVNLEMISQGASEINISCVIREDEELKALNVLHQHLLCQPLLHESVSSLRI
ncbi:hypothetical protein CANCADRAFT_55719 [Tortispora caseinolytica NRRL Y-17796]|uniref:Aspartokinase n=1 Tax=Tortispora caseinolytica NRRL Y-17796 TaxID=767744 RepID=A0A1E4TJN4_9ASCO|nr:hypothetical protein CANCADRAFT_55719 [Tortispora caseinolytica NRRL Y-17796]